MSERDFLAFRIKEHAESENIVLSMEFVCATESMEIRRRESKISSTTRIVSYRFAFCTLNIPDSFCDFVDQVLQHSDGWSYYTRESRQNIFARRAAHWILSPAIIIICSEARICGGWRPYAMCLLPSFQHTWIRIIIIIIASTWIYSKIHFISDYYYDSG